MDFIHFLCFIHQFICMYNLSLFDGLHSFSFFLQEWVAKFEKPKGDPSAFLKPATTVLSPYLKVSFVTDLVQVVVLFILECSVETDCYVVMLQFGCLSSRYFYHCIQDVYRSVRNYTKPPVSLTGQVICNCICWTWRGNQSARLLLRWIYVHDSCSCNSCCGETSSIQCLLGLLILIRWKETKYASRFASFGQPYPLYWGHLRSIVVK